MNSGRRGIDEADDGDVLVVDDGIVIVVIVAESFMILAPLAQVVWEPRSESRSAANSVGTRLQFLSCVDSAVGGGRKELRERMKAQVEAMNVGGNGIISGGNVIRRG